MNRAIVLALSVILALTMAAPTVLARSDNGTAPAPVSADLIINPGDNTVLGGSCDFPIRLDLSGKAKTIELPNGAFIMTSPGLNVTVTNEITGEQARFSITGSLFQTTAKSGDVTTVATGRNLTGDPDAGIVLLSGNFSWVFDAEGNLLQSFEDTNGKGQVIDVCALLS